MIAELIDTPEELSHVAGNVHDVLHADFIDVRVVLRAARFCNIMASELRQAGYAPFVVAFFEAQGADLIDKAIDILDAGEALFWLDPPSGELH